MRLDLLIDGLPLTVRRGDPRSAQITEATLDLDEVRPGVLFIARRAWYGDTHAQLHEAAARGAAALLISRDDADLPGGALPILSTPTEDPTLGLLCDRLYGHPTRRLRVFGVTGTNGKTSTTWLLEHLLASRGRRVALMGTVAYRFGDRTLPAPNTTPDALVIHRFARDALRLGATDLILEVSSHGLALERVAGVRFDAVGFTNLTRDHLDFHGDRDAYRDAKRRLFGPCLAFARAEGKRPAAVACIEGDGEGRGFAAAARDAGAQVWSIGEAPGDAPGRQITLEIGASSLTAGTPLGLRHGPLTARCRLPLIGHHNALNAALALTLLEAVEPGALPSAVAAMARAPGIPGRLEAALPPGAADLTALVDYAHTPDAVARVLAAVRSASDGPLTALLGCGGDRDPGKRPLMAAAALACADRVILTSDNPRSEPPDAILAMMTDGLSPADRARCTCLTDRAEALAFAVASAAPGETLLALGKGHEPYQIEGPHTYHLADADLLRRALLARRLGRDPRDLPRITGWPLRRLLTTLGAALDPPDAAAHAAWPLASLLLAEPHSAAGVRLGADLPDVPTQLTARVEDLDAALLRLALAVLQEQRAQRSGLTFSSVARPPAPRRDALLRLALLPAHAPVVALPDDAPDALRDLSAPAAPPAAPRLPTLLPASGVVV